MTVRPFPLTLLTALLLVVATSAAAPSPAPPPAAPAEAAPADAAPADADPLAETPAQRLRRERDMAVIHADLVDRQSNWFANLATILMTDFALVVSVLVLFFTIRFGKSAVAEAKAAAMEGIEGERNRMEALATEAQTAVARIREHDAQAQAILRGMNPDNPPQDAATKKDLRDRAAEAEKKPRNARSADDYRALIMIASIDEDWALVEQRASAMAYLHEGADAEDLAFALYAKGVALGKLNRPAEALAVFDALLQRFGDSDAAALQEPVAMAMLNKGVALGQLGRADEALAAYDALLQRFGDSEAAALQEVLAKAMYIKGVRLGKLGRADEILAAYDALLQRFGDSEEAALQELVAMALFNTACVHGRRGDGAACIAALGQWRDRVGGLDHDRIAAESNFYPVRDDPAFTAFLAAN